MTILLKTQSGDVVEFHGELSKRCCKNKDTDEIYWNVYTQNCEGKVVSLGKYGNEDKAQKVIDMFVGNVVVHSNLRVLLFKMPSREDV